MSKNLLNILLAVSTFALYYLLINPLYNGTGGVWQPEESIKMLRDLNGQYDETLRQANELYSQAETLRGQYSRISQDQKDMMKIMVPDSIDKVRLLSEVTNVAGLAGLKLENISYSDGSIAASGRGYATISFSVKTTYEKFKELMYAFETSMRLFSIQSVSFSSPAEDGQLTSYQVRLDTYFLK
ncbi:MAG: hypothetical protein RIQ41_281 [Candidatus Parcubacteria bacterium]|jgi:hypothetical protein